MKPYAAWLSNKKSFSTMLGCFNGEIFFNSAEQHLMVWPCFSGPWGAGWVRACLGPRRDKGTSLEIFHATKHFEYVHVRVILWNVQSNICEKNSRGSCPHEVYSLVGDRPQNICNIKIYVMSKSKCISCQTLTRILKDKSGPSETLGLQWAS